MKTHTMNFNFSYNSQTSDINELFVGDNSPICVTSEVHDSGSSCKLTFASEDQAFGWFLENIEVFDASNSNYDYSDFETNVAMFEQLSA